MVLLEDFARLPVARDALRDPLPERECELELPPEPLLRVRFEVRPRVVIEAEREPLLPRDDPVLLRDFPVRLCEAVDRELPDFALDDLLALRFVERECERALPELERAEEPELRFPVADWLRMRPLPRMLSAGMQIISSPFMRVSPLIVEDLRLRVPEVREPSLRRDAAEPRERSPWLAEDARERPSPLRAGAEDSPLPAIVRVCERERVPVLRRLRPLLFSG